MYIPSRMLFFPLEPFVSFVVCYLDLKKNSTSRMSHDWAVLYVPLLAPFQEHRLSPLEGLMADMLVTYCMSPLPFPFDCISRSFQFISCTKESSLRRQELRMDASRVSDVGAGTVTVEDLFRGFAGSGSHGQPITGTRYSATACQWIVSFTSVKALLY